MKDLMVMNSSKELTMSHLQFAEMTGKRTDNVKRLMEKLENQQVIELTKSEEVQIEGKRELKLGCTRSYLKQDSLFS